MMLNEEVVLLDSDEEAPKAIETMSTTPVTIMNDKEDTLDKDNETGIDDSEEIVEVYDHYNTDCFSEENDLFVIKYEMSLICLIYIPESTCNIL